MCKSTCTTNKSTAVVSIKPQQRVTEFPGEHLVYRVKWRVKNHIQSTKPNDSKNKLKAKEKESRILVQALQRLNDECHLRGETLPRELQVFMSKLLFVVRAAVPLNKLDCFRDLPEECACGLTDRRHMSALVPFILKEEQSRIQEELAGRHVAVTFDGTTRLGKALAIVLCYVSDE